MDQKSEIEKIKVLSKEIRKNILTMSLSAGASSSHFGGSLSTVEILATLYNNVLKFKPPMVFLRKNAQQVIQSLEQTLSIISW